MSDLVASSHLVVFAPHGDDARIIGELCDRAQVAWEVAEDADALCGSVGSHTLGWIATEEALAAQVAQLSRCLSKQPAWSDLPVIVLTARRKLSSDAARQDLFDTLGHVTLLERPLRSETLVRAIGVVSRTRSRQFQLREQMERLAESAEKLEHRVVERTQELQSAIKQREAAEKALVQSQRLEAIGQLTGGVAHDFNNLLQVMVSSASIIEHAPTNDKLRNRAVENIRHTASRGSRLTQQLLAFASRQPLAAEAIDLRMHLRALTEMLERSLRADIQLSVTAPESLWFVRADAAQLDVAILNLAVNARDAMPDGGALTIAMRNEVVAPIDSRSSPGRFVRIDVADTGTGMDERTISRAFEPFYTTKARGKGTGLGLSQVYGFARQLGGEAFIKSTSASGTSVTIRLPAADVEAPTPKEPAQSIDDQAAAQWRRVLVVEDEFAVAESTCEMLQALGFDTVLARSGDEAIRASLQGIDFVFSDVIMPGKLDGVSLAQELRRQHPELPILLASGYVGAPERVSTSGFPLLSKPYTREQLMRAIQVLASEAVPAN